VKSNITDEAKSEAQANFIERTDIAATLIPKVTFNKVTKVPCDSEKHPRCSRRDQAE